MSVARLRGFVRRLSRSATAGLKLWLCVLAFSTVAHAEETVRIGFYQGARREMSRTDLRNAFSLWSQELAATFKLPVSVTFYEDIDKMRTAFERGEINAVNADAMTLATKFNPADLADGFSVAVPGGWNMLLLASRESDIHSVGGLLGKRIALLEDDQTATTYLETVCWRQYGRECSKVFSDIQHVPTNSQAVMRLFFGKVDAVLVYRYGYELSREMNPQLRQKIGPVLAEVPFSGMYYAFFSGKVPGAFVERNLKLIPTLHTYPRGRQLLDIFKMDHLEVASPQELEPFLQLDDTLRELKNQHARKTKGK